MSCLDIDISTPPTILHTVVDMPQILLSKGELVNKSNTIGGTMSKVFLKWLPCFVFNANKMDNKSSESPLKCDEKWARVSVSVLSSHLGMWGLDLVSWCRAGGRADADFLYYYHVNFVRKSESSQGYPPIIFVIIHQKRLLKIYHTY